jgi:hypothetical protein
MVERPSFHHSDESSHRPSWPTNITPRFAAHEQFVQRLSAAPCFHCIFDTGVYLIALCLTPCILRAGMLGMSRRSRTRSISILQPDLFSFDDSSEAGLDEKTLARSSVQRDLVAIGGSPAVRTVFSAGEVGGRADIASNVVSRSGDARDFPCRPSQLSAAGSRTRRSLHCCAASEPNLVYLFRH